MPSLGGAEIIVVLLVALLVFGPQRLPELSRQLGGALRELRRVQHDVRSELRDALDINAMMSSGGEGSVTDVSPTPAPSEVAYTIDVPDSATTPPSAGAPAVADAVAGPDVTSEPPSSGSFA